MARVESESARFRREIAGIIKDDIEGMMKEHPEFATALATASPGDLQTIVSRVMEKLIEQRASARRRVS